MHTLMLCDYAFSRYIRVPEVGAAIRRLKADGEVGMKWMTDVCNVVVRDGRILENME